MIDKQDRLGISKGSTNAMEILHIIKVTFKIYG